MDKLFKELKRRNVFKVAAMYLVVGWGLVQISDTIAPMMNLPSWAPKTVLFFLIIGFPIALILSWAYELTSEGLTADKKGQNLSGLFFTLIILGGGGLYWYNTTPEPTPTFDEAALQQAEEKPTGVTIAVLPFVNMSDDASNEFFSDGISEEILNVLVRVQGLVVTSRTSSFAFKGNIPNMPEVAKTLNVDHVLEGSVRKHGNRVRITAQLIDARADKHLWSETYERELTDIFAIQDEIASAIVIALRAELGTDITPTINVTALTQDMTAYELYLKARELFLERRVKESIELFETVVARDPGFTKAWEGLATAYSIAQTYVDNVRGDKVNTEKAWVKAGFAAKRAMELDPTLALPHSVLGRYYGEKNEWVKSQAEHDLAVKLDPKQPTVRLWRGIRYLYLGYFDRAITDLKIAQQLDPDVGVFTRFYQRALYADGQNKKALFYMNLFWKKRPVVDPYLFIDNGNNEAAFLYVLLRLSINLDVPKEEQIKIANAWFDLVTSKGDTSSERVHLLGLIAKNSLTNIDRSNEWLFKSVWSNNQYATYFQENVPNRFQIWEPITKRFRQSEAFKTMEKNMGMVAYWQTKGWPKLCQPLSGDDFKCD